MAAIAVRFFQTDAKNVAICCTFTSFMITYQPGHSYFYFCRIKGLKSVVERPYLYMFGLCKANLFEQGKYSEPRIADLSVLRESVAHAGREYKDVLRFMSGWCWNVW